MPVEIKQVPWEAVFVSRAADLDVPIVNTDAVVNYAAVPNSHHVGEGIGWSYDDDPTGGEINIYSGGVRIRHWYITSSGAGFLPFRIASARGQNLRLELVAAGAAVSGSIQWEKHWVESS